MDTGLQGKNHVGLEHWLGQSFLQDDRSQRTGKSFAIAFFLYYNTLYAPLKFLCL